MRSLAIKLFLIASCYVLGERLAAAILQQGMDEGLGFWGVMSNAFNAQNYSFGYFAPIIVVGFLILFSDAITPGRLKPIALSLTSAFSAAYYYVMYFGYHYASGFEQAYDHFLSQFPASVHETIGGALFALALAGPFVLLIVLKIAVAEFRRDVHRPTAPA